MTISLVKSQFDFQDSFVRSFYKISQIAVEDAYTYVLKFEFSLEN